MSCICINLYIYFLVPLIYIHSQYDNDSRHKSHGTKKYVINKITPISVFKVY